MKEEGEKAQALDSSYLFWSDSCREMPQSQSASPDGGSRARIEAEIREQKQKWGSQLPLTNTKERDFSSNLPPDKLDTLPVSQPEKCRHSLSQWLQVGMAWAERTTRALRWR